MSKWLVKMSIESENEDMEDKEEEKEKGKGKAGPRLHDWKKQIIPIDVIELFNWYKKNRQGKKPKLRGLFYHLLQKGIIKIKTTVTYNTFSSEMSYARLESGVIPLDSVFSITFLDV